MGSGKRPDWQWPARNVYIINQGRTVNTPFNLFNQNNIDKRHSFQR
jgi:hypothetical protein